MSWRKYKKVGNFLSSNRKRNKKKIDKNGNDNITTVSYKIKFIDGARFIASSLSNPVNNSQKEFIKLNAKMAIVFLNTKV